MTDSPITDDSDGAAASARASLIYSAIPYLGIIFLPAALVFIVLALRRDRRTAVRLLVLCAVSAMYHLTLWRLLYVVPELGRNGL